MDFATDDTHFVKFPIDSHWVLTIWNIQKRFIIRTTGFWFKTIVVAEPTLYTAYVI